MLCKWIKLRKRFARTSRYVLVEHFKLDTSLMKILKLSLLNICSDILNKLSSPIHAVRYYVQALDLLLQNNYSFNRWT